MKIHPRIVFAIGRKNMQILFKDKRTIGLLVFMPALLMLLFGYGFGQSVNHVPIKVVNLDEGGAGIPLLNISDTTFSDIGISFLEDDERVDITLLSQDSFNLTEEIDKIYGGNNYYALVVFPVNFSENMPDFNQMINISVFLDGSDILNIGSVKGAIAEMVGEIVNSLTQTNPHVNLDIDYVAGDPDLRPVDTMAPGILSFALLLFMILTVTGGFTKERITGTIHRVLTTPATKADIILDYMLGNSVIAIVQSFILLLIAVLVFQMQIVGNIFLLYLILLIYALSCVGIGILASAFAENELQAFQFIPLILIPSMFFSGFLFPLNSFPKIFQWLSYIIPMTYSIRIGRAIMINGFGFEMFQQDFYFLCGLTALYLFLAVVLFKTKK